MVPGASPQTNQIPGAPPQPPDGIAMRLIHALTVGSTLLAVSASITPVLAAGYWNMPGTFCQCMGAGWGAGYHAPFILGPITWDGWCDHNEVRLPFSPPPRGGRPCYGEWNHNGGYDYYGGAPSRLNSGLAAPIQFEAPSPLLFGPPIEP